jgi:hypothetical protein
VSCTRLLLASILTCGATRKSDHTPLLPLSHAHQTAASTLQWIRTETHKTRRTGTTHTRGRVPARQRHRRRPQVRDSSSTRQFDRGRNRNLRVREASPKLPPRSSTTTNPQGRRHNRNQQDIPSRRHSRCHGCSIRGRMLGPTGSSCLRRRDWRQDRGLGKGRDRRRKAVC